ncbi:hypothetical protein [Leuconostoc lactis]|uniref:hypothetical protein n=1 Tax=Leuconostoc lactis TaxID=1246 RepID=UPI00289807EB|nr:hypothetical protein [Leuconostoc lactis]
MGKTILWLLLTAVFFAFTLYTGYKTNFNFGVSLNATNTPDNSGISVSVSVPLIFAVLTMFSGIKWLVYKHKLTAKTVR